MPPRIKTRPELEKEWARKGFSCGLWSDPPGQRWEDYVHEVDELVYVIEGTMEFEIEGRKKILKPGEGAFIPAGVNHSARNPSPVTARWYYGYRSQQNR